MADKRTAEVLLRYKVDQASVNQVSNNLEDLIGEIDDLQSQLRAVGRDGASGLSGLTRELPRAETGIEALQDEVVRLRKELLSLDDVKVTPVVDVQSADGTSIKGNSTLNTVDRFGRFGTQISGAFGQAGGLGNVVGLVGDVADSFGTLGVAGGAAALAIGGLSIAINELQRIADAAKSAEEARLAGQRAGEELAGSPLQVIADRAKELSNQIAANEEAIADRRQQISNLQAQYAGADLARAQEYYGRVAGLNNDIRDFQNDNLTFLGELTQIGETLPALVRDVAGLQNAFTLLQGAIVPLVQPAIDAANAFNTIKGLLGSLQPTIDVLSGGVDKLREQAFAAVSQLRTDKTDAYLGAITKTIQAQEQLTAAQNAYNEAVAASQQRISDINAKLQADLSQAETERQNELADAARRAGEDRVRITEDAEKERARIQSRFEKSYSTAVAERDALAAKRAEDQKDDELKQLDDRYKDQLKTVDDSLKKQNATIQARYDQQVRTINAAAQAAIRTEQQAAQARLNVLQQGVQAAQVALVNAQQSEYLIKANFYNQSVNQAASWANLMQLYMAYGFSIPNTISPYNPKQPGIIGKASGGPVAAMTPYIVGEKGPELFVPQTPGHIVPNGGASMVTINLTGAQMGTIKATSRQQVLATLNRMFDQMGVA